MKASFGLAAKCTFGHMGIDRRIDRWIDRRMDRRMDRWIDRGR